VLVALALATVAGTRAGTHVWSGAINDQWNLPGNWSSGGAPSANEAAPVILIFPSDPEIRSATRNNIPGLTVDRLSIQRGGYQFSASGSVLRLRGTGAKIATVSSQVAATTTFTPSFSLYLLDEAGFDIGVQHTVVVQSRISGPGALVKTGNGFLELAGTAANVYQGLTRVEAGQLRLNKPAGTLAVPGDLYIGLGTAANEDVVRLLTSDQLNSARKVVVGASGWLDLNHRNQAITGLDLNGGRVSTGTGTLTLLGDVVTTASIRTALIQGKLSLGGQTRTFITALGTASGTDLRVTAQLSSGGLFPGLRKEGPGRLELGGNNTYGGTTTIAEGWLSVTTNTGLGVANGASLLPSGTVVHAGATLSLVGVNIGDEDLVLSGSGVQSTGALVAQSVQQYAGRIALQSDAIIRVGNLPANTSTLTRRVSGAGKLIKTGPGALRLAGAEANTFTGGAEIREGSLVLAKPAGVLAASGPVVIGDGLGGLAADALWLETAGQLPGNAAVHLNSSGLLTIPSGRSEVIGPLSGDGRLVLEGRLSLNVPAGQWVFNGQSAGGGELRKSGTGTLVLGGSLQHDRTRITGGRVLLDSPVNGSRTIVAGGILGGNGHTGRIEGQSGRVAPGMSPGVLITSDLQFTPNLEVQFELNGLTGGNLYDQVFTLGGIHLGAARLDVQLNFAPPVGTQFLLFLNDGTDPVVGTFAGLPEGTTFQANGVPLRITYRGGSGANDVLLEVVEAPVSPTGRGPRRLANGALQFGGRGEPFQPYRVDRSTDLKTWEPLDTWHVRDSGTSKRLNDVAFGHDKFVAVGEEGTILVSPDGAAWLPVDSGTPARLDAIAFGNGVFVAVGGLGSKPMFTSPDGLHWTPRTTTIAGGYLDVAFNGEVFFTLAGKGAFGISANGVDWTPGKIPTSQDPAAVAYGNGSWVVAGYKPTGAPHGMLWTSPDTQEWTPRESALGNHLFAAGSLGALLVVAGQTGLLASSPDGITWTPRDSQTTGFIWDFASNGTYLVAASQYGRMVYSTNGTDWTRAETGLPWHLTGVTYGAGTFVAVGWEGQIAQSDPVADPGTDPRLSIRREAGKVIVAWPNSASGYSLQSSPHAAGGTWQPVNAPVVEGPAERTVTLDPADSTKVFRLAQ
jgi:autotransporter-associated beta strand protein